MGFSLRYLMSHLVYTLSTQDENTPKGQFYCLVCDYFDENIIGLTYMSPIWNLFTLTDPHQHVYSAWKQIIKINQKWMSRNAIKADIKSMKGPLNMNQELVVKLRTSPGSTFINWNSRCLPFLLLNRSCFFLGLISMSHRIGLGCWVSRRLKRFFTVTRCRENLSSGEKRAGWAELVGWPLGLTFCWRQRRKRESAENSEDSPGYF